jgi:hypothetical protein
MSPAKSPFVDDVATGISWGDDLVSDAGTYVKPFYWTYVNLNYIQGSRSNTEIVIYSVPVIYWVFRTRIQPRGLECQGFFHFWDGRWFNSAW